MMEPISHFNNLTLQVISIRDVQSKGKFGSSKIKKVFDLHVAYDNDTSFTIEITQSKLQKLITEIKKELYNISISSVTINSNATNDLTTLFQTFSSNPKIAKSNSLAKFLESEGNKVLSRKFITEEFMKDINHQGVLQKIKNKHNLTKKERICFIKYHRILYYYTPSKQCKGAICLDECVVSKTKDAQTFELQTPSAGTYLFCAQSAMECDQWITCLKKCLEVCQSAKIKVNGQLSGTIIKGRDFAKKDLNGYADPFAITRIERQQIRTPTIYKTLNPIWNEQFYFDITKNEGYFYLLVWDEDKFSAADFMGKIIIPLTALPPGQELQMHLPLIPKTSKNKVTGDVFVKLKYIYTTDTPISNGVSIFGQSLSSFESRPESKDGLPGILFDFINFFEQYGLKEEGLFRICGSNLDIKSHKQQIDSGQTILFTPDKIHTLAGVFKLFFRELPEPILTFEKYDAFLSISTNNANVKQITTLIKSLPKVNQKLLQLLLPFFYNIGRVENSKYNMMNFSNLAIVFGPAMLRQAVETDDSILKLNSINDVTRRLIEFAPSIFVE
ncbi:pleckstrin domain-containing protein [Heterostelium album PN500]|uniref:Pleckstrin domain-containing protein n=1 Tax=Heterostelium pallidum (strain ATCC 26659 / Pp 5 / PN500) TaxID=670386 RepID=D3B5M7_HETP5|nr:pleckstrin domain-containing protein [Heterostelium album PN500]EFA83175.1 pleckstrin domain-containing protein [Heterostelium album PN500]|eukprot:XP_020435292.1 pleckstrin domain-containing protein [Heterostelium album PN500]